MKSQRHQYHIIAAYVLAEYDVEQYNFDEYVEASSATARIIDYIIHCQKQIGMESSRKTYTNKITLKISTQNGVS